MRTLTSSRKRRVKKVAALAAAVGVAVCVLSGDVVADSTGATDTSAKKEKLRENSYYYGSFNRRDPFASLIVGDFISEKKMNPVELGRVELVGLVKSELDRFAMLEDNKGYSYILRVGDKVRNGSVVAIGDQSVVARVTTFGQTRKVTLHLAKRREGETK